MSVEAAPVQESSVLGAHNDEAKETGTKLSTAKTSSPPVEEAEVVDVTEFDLSSADALEQQLVVCGKAGSYEEAHQAKVKLQQLKQHEEERLCEEFRKQQEATLSVVEESHAKEIAEFNEIWDKKGEEYQEHAGGLQSKLAERHKKEHEAYLEKLQREVAPRTPRWSTNLHNARKIQEALAKQKKFAEAATTKIQCDKLEAQEYEAWKTAREAKVKSLEERFFHKQELEANGLAKRVQSGLEEQQQARATELERLLLRYNNIKSQLISQQKIVQQHVEKNPLVNSPEAASSPLASRQRQKGARSQKGCKGSQKARGG